MTQFMKVTAITIRPGHVVEHEGKYWLILKNTILQPGKGGAFVQVEMRDLKSGNKMNHRWRTQENVERAHTEERPATFLFAEGDALTFMDQHTYDQHQVSASIVGDARQFLTDGMAVTLDFIAGDLVGIRLPPMLTVTVAECEPVVKGQTASSSYKPAVLDNGVRIMVPPHITVGMKIVINSSDLSYAERAKDQT